MINGFSNYCKLLAVGVLCNGFAHAQAPQLVKLTPPSPNVMAMQKYGDIPVSAYTGIPDVSIPIYTVRFRDITVPISLSYHASGIKVAEDASQEGLGWTLNAAGTISRNIMGDDDFNGTVYFDSNLRDFVDGQGPTNALNMGCNLSLFNPNNVPTIFNYDITASLTGSPPKDFQPDQYYYNYPGHSGKFIMKRNLQAVLQKQESIQITCLASDGSSWQIKSADGYVYDFNAYETYTDFTVHKSAWYLTKITSPTGNMITFNYTTVSNYVQSVGSFSETKDDLDFVYPSTALFQPTSTGYQYGAVPGKQYSQKVLSSIDFTNGKVLFYYSGGRTDLPNDQKLDSISIFNQAEVNPVKSFALAYDYFTCTNDPSFSNGSGNATQRLKLTQVTEKGYYYGQFIQNPPYIFTYNESNYLPAKTSFARDHWGYYNGVTGKSTLLPSVVQVYSTDPIITAMGLPGPEREPNPGLASAFSLTSIKYPSGGWTEFQYESNDYDETQSQVNDQSWFAHNTQTLTQKSSNYRYDAVSHQYAQSPNTLDLTNEFQASNGTYTQVTLSAYFRFSGGTGGNCNDITGGNTNLIYFVLKNSSGGTVMQVDPFAVAICNAQGTNTPCVGCQTGSPVFTYSNTYSLSPGVYTWQAFVGSSGAALKLQDMSATYSWYELQSVNASQGQAIITGGGLRIKRIIDHDGVNEYNNKVRHYVYHYWADKTNSGTVYEYSWGRRMSKPRYSYFTPNVDIYTDRPGGACRLTGFSSLHLMRSSDSNNPLNGSAAGAVVGYDHVEEWLGENGEFGKKVFNYYNNPDYVVSYSDPFSGQGLPLRPPYNANTVDPLNGSLLNQADYVNIKGQFFKVKEATNQYTLVPANENVDYAAENRVTPTIVHGDLTCSVIPASICDNNSLTLTSKIMKSEWSYMTSTDEKLYNEKGDTLHYAETMTNYYYDNPTHLQLTRTVSTNSKGESTTSTIRYPLDFVIPGGASDAFSLGLQNLINKHIVSAPVETYSWKKKADNSDIGATSYVLTSYNSTLPTPSLAYVSMLSAPNTGFTASTINSTGLVKDAAYQPLISFDTYDANGNLNQQHKVNDVNHAYLWDYNNALVIAEVSNAALTEIAYTGFEADGSGRWTIPSTTRNVGNSITGNQSYTMTATAITATVPSGKNYVVSYWSKSGALNVNGVSATTGIARNGWTYYEHVLPNTTTSISVSGTGAIIDELRLYPKDAQMMTYAYYPAVGLISGCDANSNLVYYVYDALGRLRAVKDADGNIVKTYQYNYQGQVGN